jgi:hypothetical protein
VITAELISSRIACHTVADTITIMMPTAAQTTSQGLILVSPGSVSPYLLPRGEANGNVLLPARSLRGGRSAGTMRRWRCA